MDYRCLLGLHRRDGDEARFRNGAFRTTCKRCRTPLFRNERGRWAVDREARRMLQVEHRGED